MRGGQRTNVRFSLPPYSLFSCRPPPATRLQWGLKERHGPDLNAFTWLRIGLGQRVLESRVPHEPAATIGFRIVGL